LFFIKKNNDFFKDLTFLPLPIKNQNRVNAIFKNIVKKEKDFYEIIW